MMNIEIRPYQENDKRRIYDICCDSAFLGNRIDDIFVDREWFASLVILPYLILEPQHTWVAECDGRVVGYLTGSVEENFGYYRLEMVVVRVVQLGVNYLCGLYDHHPRSKQFVRFVMKNGLLQIPKHPEKSAHFHFNVEPEYRARGVGKKLLNAFKDMLKSKGLGQYYAEVMCSENRKPESYYERLGYQIYDRVKTDIFFPEIAEPVYVVCVYKQEDSF
jgi:GNAT superfamily N-acetyltransferase